MGILELILLSVGLAMDAFSVSVCKGLNMKKLSLKNGAVIALFFGVFQAGMPLIGYFLGSRFADFISSFSHWVAFILLAVIGGKMVFEAVHGGDDDESGEFSLKIGELFILAVATSIDALAVGIVFVAAKVNLILSVSMIGIITFLLSFAGVIIGHKFGSRFEKKAEIAGGIILILIGLKLLLDGLGIL
ncbi:MAG: manganese efflux pump [Ruminococcus sp.]|nr:manganese efflux pump [Ruminococcus sp.]